jgi:hypothetical protein
MTDVEQKIAALEKEIAKQKEELARLRGEPHKPVGKPWEKIDWTARMSMPPSAIAEIVRAVPDSLVRAVVADNLRAQQARSASPPPAEPAQKGTGWVDPAPLKPPPGVGLCDRMMDQQDARDRAAQMLDAEMRARLRDRLK